MREKPFIYKIVDSQGDPELEELEERVNKAFERLFGELEEGLHRIEVRKELQDTVESMTADERAKSLERYPGVKKQMTIEEYSMFISTGDIPAHLIKHFSVSGTITKADLDRAIEKVFKRNAKHIRKLIPKDEMKKKREKNRDLCKSLFPDNFWLED